MSAVSLALGSYTPATGGRGRGLALVRWDGARLSKLSELDANSPSFLTWGADGRILYAVEETSVGRILAVSAARDRLAPLNALTIDSARPCQLALHPSGRLLTASCYGGGAFVTTVIGDDGALERRGTGVQHAGRGPHPTRQDRAHPHAVVFTPHGARALLLDLGTDTISLHTVTSEGIRPEPIVVARSESGSGPRHALWIDDGVLAVVEEITATVTLFRITETDITRLGPAVATTADADPGAWPSEIAANGGVIAVANRTPGSIVELTPQEGALRVEREIPLPPGANPRHFAVLPDRNYILALQDADQVVVMDRDGRILSSLPLGSPSCVAIRPEGR